MCYFLSRDALSNIQISFWQIERIYSISKWWEETLWVKIKDKMYAFLNKVLPKAEIHLVTLYWKTYNIVYLLRSAHPKMSQM